MKTVKNILTLTSASREEVEARVVRALELLEQAERKRAARGKGGDPWAM